MQKYHRAFLFFVTALIAASFGMGTVCLSVVDRQDTEIVATFTGKSINAATFRDLTTTWNSIFRLAETLSPKAKKITSKEYPTSEEEYERMAYARNPLWDSIYSLREEVAKLDMEFDQYIGTPEIWKAVLSRRFPLFELEYQYYLRLQEPQREKIRTMSINDVWNMAMLTAEAQSWEIQVTPKEIENFIADTQKTFGTADSFQRYLENRRIPQTQFETMAGNILTVLKYLQSRCSSVKIPAETVYQTYTQLHNQYRLQWTSIAQNAFQPKDDKAYEEERLAFYDEKIKQNRDYFKIPATTDFEYIFAGNALFDKVVGVTSDEIEAEVKIQVEQKPNDLLDEEDMQALRKDAEQKIRQRKLQDRARQQMSEIHDKIATFSENVSLEPIASHYNLVYEVRHKLAEEEFLSDEHVGTPDAKTQVYQVLPKGGLSPVIAAKDQGFCIIRLLDRTTFPDLTRDEVKSNETKFLECFYRQNKKEFSRITRYRMGYVVLDSPVVRQNLLVTTTMMQNFYDKYKDQLYKVEKKEKDGPEFISFAQARSDIEKRVANFTAIQELQKIHVVHQICKDKGKDVDVKAIVQELASQIMLAPDSLRYVESPVLLTEDEIRHNNPTGDQAIAIASGQNQSLSDVKDSPTGKYFYKILEEEASKDEFVLAEVKNHFVKAVAMDKANNQAKELRQNFKDRYEEMKKSWEQEYAARIQQLKKDGDKTITPEAQKEIAAIEKSKQQKLGELGQKLFAALALQAQLTCQTTAVLENFAKIPEFKNLANLENSLATMPVGELSNPYSDPKLGSVFVVQIVEKKSPEFAEIPRGEWEYLYNLLWERAYRSHRLSFLNYKILSERMKLEQKKKDLDSHLD